MSDNEYPNINIEDLTEEHLDKYTKLYKSAVSDLKNALDGQDYTKKDANYLREVIIEQMRQSFESHVKQHIRAYWKEGKLRVELPLCFLTYPMMCELEFSDEQETDAGK